MKFVKVRLMDHSFSRSFIRCITTLRYYPILFPNSAYYYYPFYWKPHY